MACNMLIWWVLATSCIEHRRAAERFHPCVPRAMLLKSF